MLINDNTTMSFNNYIDVPKIPYKIVEALIKYGSEDFWKLLKYQEIDALEQPNLTTQEKKDFIWTGQTDEQNYNIFLKTLIGNSLDDSEQQIRIHIFRYSTQPTTRLEGTLVYEFNIIAHEKCSNIRKDGIIVERTDLLEQEILSVLNGRDIGIGTFMAFDKELIRTCQSMMNISNSKTFYGRSLWLGVKLIAPDRGGGC